jgi:hypothetical protein
MTLGNRLCAPRAPAVHSAIDIVQKEAFCRHGTREPHMKSLSSTTLTNSRSYTKHMRTQ